MKEEKRLTLSAVSKQWQSVHLYSSTRNAFISSLQLDASGGKNKRSFFGKLLEKNKNNQKLSIILD